MKCIRKYAALAALIWATCSPVAAHETTFQVNVTSRDGDRVQISTSALFRSTPHSTKGCLHMTDGYLVAITDASGNQIKTPGVAYCEAFLRLSLAETSRAFKALVLDGEGRAQGDVFDIPINGGAIQVKLPPESNKEVNVAIRELQAPQ